VHMIAAKAVAFGEALTEDFKAYARRVVENARTLADALTERGFAIVSGGTDSHLMLVDLRPKDLTGKAAEKVLGHAGITVNKNTIPDDPQSPFVTSGIRLGTPAVTTRGMGVVEMRLIAELIDRALTRSDEENLSRVRAEVEELTGAFSLYESRPARPGLDGARKLRAASAVGAHR
jgi:glycine hydroxymethyltransferase